MQSKLPYRFRILIFLFFLIIITFLDRNCIALVGTRVKEDFKLSNEQFGWVLAAFSLSYALFEIPSGILGDRIGQRSVLMRIVIWWSFFTILTGFATGLVSLILIRFLFGMGEAGVFPTSVAVISRWFPFAETARGVAFMLIGINAGSALAPLMIVPLADEYGWRSTFFVNGIIGFCWIIFCYAWFRNHPSEMKGISEKEKKYIEENRRFSAHSHPFKLSIALKNRSLRALSAIHFCSQWGFYFFIAWLPVYLQEGRHFSERDMKLTTFVVFVAAVFFIPLAGLYSDWLVKRKGLVFSRRLCGFIALGGTGLGILITGASSNNTVAVVSLVVAQLAYSFNGIANYSTCIDIGGNYAGAATGVMNFCGQIGGLLLSLMFGKLADLAHNFNTPVLIVAAVLIVGCLLWLFVDPRRKIILQDEKNETTLKVA